MMQRSAIIKMLEDLTILISNNLDQTQKIFSIKFEAQEIYSKYSK